MMTTYTSTLPEDILKRLSRMAQKLNRPKNKIIESALILFLDQLEQKMYERSYQSLADDEDMITMAEEGMEDYYQLLKEWDEKG